MGDTGEKEKKRHIELVPDERPHVTPAPVVEPAHEPQPA